MTAIPRRIYTTAEMEADLRHLVAMIEADGYRPDCVAGILRGGLVPAVYLSHWFKIPMITIPLALRDYCVHGLTPALADSLRNQSVLVVDDLVDGGATLHQLCQWGNREGLNLRTAVLLYNSTNSSGTHPDFYGQTIDKITDPRWITFPWEEWPMDNSQ